MLTLIEKNDEGTLVRFIVGKETNLSMEINGPVVMDIKQILDRSDLTKPFRISFCTVYSEVEFIEETSCANMPPPFYPPMIALEVDNTKDAKKKEKKTNLVTGKCSECLQESNLMEVNGKKVCQTCVQIALGLNRKKPHAPPEGKSI